MEFLICPFALGAVELGYMSGGENYLWTQHSRIKMRQYRLTESRIKRIIRHPARVEEGILEGAIAAMSPAGGKRYSEIWVMYVLKKSIVKSPTPLGRGSPNSIGRQMSRVKVITAWRYPGKSPERDPIPPYVLREIRSII